MDDKQSTLQRPMTYLHGIIMASLLVLGIVFIPQFMTSGRVEHYQYSNIQRQKDLVDKRVAPVEDEVHSLQNRVSDSEGRINMQIKDSQLTNKKLESLMFEADPHTMMKLARDTAEIERRKLEDQLSKVQQTASPIINVSPTYNNQGK